MAYADARLRATSLMMSAALLAGLLIAAMTMRFAMAPNDAPPDGATVELVRPPKPPEPEPQPNNVRETVRTIEEAIVVLEAPAPLDTNAPPMESVIPVFQPPALPTVTDPRWSRRPSDLSRFYPARARAVGMEGEAVLDCAVSPQGALTCVVAQETPAGWGFGEAAQRIAREHRMVPATREGQPVEARYRMRLPFQLN